jgi:hypothetical protein
VLFIWGGSIDPSVRRLVGLTAIVAPETSVRRRRLRRRLLLLLRVVLLLTGMVVLDVCLIQHCCIGQCKPFLCVWIAVKTRLSPRCPYSSFIRTCNRLDGLRQGAVWGSDSRPWPLSRGLCKQIVVCSESPLCRIEFFGGDALQTVFLVVGATLEIGLDHRTLWMVASKPHVPLPEVT